MLIKTPCQPSAQRRNQWFKRSRIRHRRSSHRPQVSQWCIWAIKSRTTTRREIKRTQVKYLCYHRLVDEGKRLRLAIWPSPTWTTSVIVICSSKIKGRRRNHPPMIWATKCHWRWKSLSHLPIPPANSLSRHYSRRACSSHSTNNNSSNSCHKRRCSRICRCSCKDRVSTCQWLKLPSNSRSACPTQTFRTWWEWRQGSST